MRKIQNSPFLKNFSLLVFQDVFAQALGMLFFISLGRYLGSESLGLYSYVFSLLFFFGILFDFGLQASQLKFWSKTKQHISESIGEILILKGLLYAFGAVCLTSYVLFFEKANYVLFFFTFLYFLVDSLKFIPITYLSAQSRFSAVVKINFIDKGVGFLAATIALAFGANLLEVVIVLLGFKVLSLIPLLWKIPRLALKRPQLPVVQSVFKGGFFAFTLLLLSNLYFKVDVIMISKILSLEEAGTYTASFKLIDSLIFLPHVFMLIFFPLIAQESENNHVKTKQFIDWAFKYLTYLSTFIALFFASYHKEILHFLYGEMYISSSVLLQLLAPTVVLIFLTYPLQYYIYATSNTKHLMTRLLLLFFLNVILNFILLPHLGSAGAAIATGITEICNLGILLSFLSFRVDFTWLWKVGLASTALILFLSLTHLPLFVSLFASGALYTILLLALNFFHDIQKFLRIAKT